MNPSLPHRWCSARELREIFNREGYWDRVQSGVYREEVLKDAHPTRPLAKEPRCTRSQYIAYRDEDEEVVALVHQYLRRDGTLGLGGKPDPKAVLFQDVIHYCDMTY
jgi:hypothetical protein